MQAMPEVQSRIPPQDDPPAFGRYMPGLDGLRGLAILAVMLLHYCFWYENALSASSIGRLYVKVARNGWMGVELFFVLSGFLITGILLDSKGSPRFFRNFYARRTLRIFPLYYGVLVLVYLVLPLTPLAPRCIEAARPHQAWLWLYGTNFAVYRLGWGIPNPSPLIVTHFWSLAVEEHFYLVWPLIVYLTSKRSLVPVAIALIITPLACRHWIIMHHLRSTAYLLTPVKTDTLAMGALLAVAFRTCTARQIFRILRPMGICAAVLVFGNRIAGGAFRIHLLNFTDPTLLAVFFSWLVAEGTRQDARSIFVRLLANSPLTTLGKYSYGMYVIHQLIDQVLYQSVGTRLPHLGAVPEAILYFCIAAAITFAAALVSFHCYEKWFLRLKRYYPAQSPHPVKKVDNQIPGSTSSVVAQLEYAA